MTRTLALIPARGGSKGVPGKNRREVAGKPLLVWSVEHALAMTTPGVDVVVSTDDPAIAEVARTAGAAVLDRPAALAQDTTPTEPVVEHAIEALARDGREPDRVLLLQATSPVRRPGTLDRAVAEFERTGVDALVGVVPQAPFLWRRTDGAPTAAYDVTARPRRQDLADRDLRYRETGSLYLTRTAIYRREHNRIGGRVGLFVMADEEGIDIDTEVDLALADRWLTCAAGAGDRPGPR